MITGCFACFFICSGNCFYCFWILSKSDTAFLHIRAGNIDLQHIHRLIRQSFHNFADNLPVLFPQTFTMIFVSYFFRNGISRFAEHINPRILQSDGIQHSAVDSLPSRGVGFPGHGTFATPLVTTAPRRFRSTNSLNSAPEPKVPDATVMTGFFQLHSGQIFTFVFITVSTSVARNTGPSLQIRLLCTLECVHPLLLT